jgi:hypothetical protein
MLSTRRRLKAACAAAELLAGAARQEADQAAAQPPNDSYSLPDDASADAQQNRQPAADGVADGDVGHLPARIRVRYLELLLEWAIHTAAKSASAPSSAAPGASRSSCKTGAGQHHQISHAGADASAGSGVAAAVAHAHHDARLWRLLRLLLAAGTPSGGMALSEALPPALTAAAATVPDHAAGTDATHPVPVTVHEDALQT